MGISVCLVTYVPLAQYGTGDGYMWTCGGLHCLFTSAPMLPKLQYNYTEMAQEDGREIQFQKRVSRSVKWLSTS
jgi:hypothetical protein